MSVSLPLPAFSVFPSVLNCSAIFTRHSTTVKLVITGLGHQTYQAEEGAPKWKFQYSGMQADGSDDWPVSVELSNGKRIGADFVICAVGVVPNTKWLEGTLELHPEDLGILVNRYELVNLGIRASYLPDSSQQRAHDYLTRHEFQTYTLSYFRLCGLSEFPSLR